MSTFLCGLLVFWIAAAFYSLYRWSRLVKKYEQLADELFEAEANLSKLKLLNRLKVDWEGKPIRYEGCSNEDIKSD